jgi:aspartate kinase
MKEKGLPAENIDIRQILITNDLHTNATPLFQLIEVKANELISPQVKRKNIPVTQGFVGATVSGATTTLGRGGSDYSASILGSVLKAKAIQIWTDVDGLMTADPNIVPEAKTLESVSYQEALELAYFGAKVLHPGAVLPAMKSKIPLYILNSKRPGSSATVIHEESSKTPFPIKSIVYKKKMSSIMISSREVFPEPGFISRVFHSFEVNHVPIDMVCTSEMKILLAVEEQNLKAGIIDQLKEYAITKSEMHKALICLVGDQLRTSYGVARQIFSSISKINIYGISQGASDINITFMVDEKDVSPVIFNLHHNFFG